MVLSNGAPIHNIGPGSTFMNVENRLTWRVGQFFSNIVSVQMLRPFLSELSSTMRKIILFSFRDCITLERIQNYDNLPSKILCLYTKSQANPISFYSQIALLKRPYVGEIQYGKRAKYVSRVYASVC